MAIDGTVVDADGAPIVGATVSAMPATKASTDEDGNVSVQGAGRICQGQTDAAGVFALECLPNTYDLVVSAAGFTSEELQVEAPERKRYDVGKQLLVKIPEQEGLFLKQGPSYVEMAAARVLRATEKEGGLLHRRFCLDAEGGGATELAAGVHAFFDNEHPGWRPFKLDADGCAYRDTKNEQHQWTVEYREKAEYQTRELNRGKTVALMSLPAGDYFIADWKGFFQKDPDKTRKGAYTGHWLKVR
jgi:hypothetical protein